MSLDLESKRKLQFTFRLICVGILHIHIIKNCKRLQLLLNVVGGAGLLEGSSESLKWLQEKPGLLKKQKTNWKNVLKNLRGVCKLRSAF